MHLLLSGIAGLVISLVIWWAFKKRQTSSPSTPTTLMLYENVVEFILETQYSQQISISATQVVTQAIDNNMTYVFLNRGRISMCIPVSYTRMFRSMIDSADLTLQPPQRPEMDVTEPTAPAPAGIADGMMAASFLGIASRRIRDSRTR
jgi:hypothetical protein